MFTLFVIKNCDTCRKARKALDEKGLPYQVHDLREDGLSAALLEHILARVPVMEALNRRSTTWRNLPEEEKKEVDANKARSLIMTNPTLLKRPMLDTGDSIIVGYHDGDYDALKG
ncbi:MULTISPECIES: Spx/MgsR family RNA polymerase-binding regulatory protein [Halomonas]|uniref:Regulatory protein Spx n=1 Tax=Halomonas chromatireducens TaxID=507626 RepID=A0A125R0I0_9GAMM|nr:MULTISPECIES: Spx/MgsR family RNA polymerase-binding regulatory protein [Halomonas]AMD02033.1 Regulatory protein Spx [Halomonas chromatireducens]MBZ0330196.1 Spx/MgsR family RNA polymerase-binding regulatory protein [Halomonas sp. ANAO-440]